MSKVLVITYGFLGDHLFISSVAPKLKQMGYSQVDFLIGFPQVYELLENHPDIDNVYISEEATISPAAYAGNYDISEYDNIIEMRPFDFSIPPTIQAQQYCGIPTELQSPEYTIYTSHTNDILAQEFVNAQRAQFGDKPIICYARNWKQKAYLWTEEQYWNGQDHPTLGYGGALRDVDNIVSELSKDYIMVPLGVPTDVSQFEAAKNPVNPYRSFLQDASILKYSDYFIGNEGGMANLAAGVGCKTALTLDFMWQCYGPRGSVRVFPNGPKLGPIYYFPPEAGHIYFPLFKTDAELIDLIKEHVG